MKHKKLQVFLLILLSACNSGIETIYKKVQTPGSGYIYISNVQSVQDELATLQNALNEKLNDNFHTLIGTQINMISFNLHCMNVRGDSIGVVCTKPPNPCPPTPFDSSYLISAKCISYFTRSAWGKAEIYKNGKLILVLNKSSYNDLTKMLTARVPKKLLVTKGDILLLKLPVEYRDPANSIQRKIIEYKEVIKFKK
jgi:hypothetical protein